MHAFQLVQSVGTNRVNTLLLCSGRYPCEKSVPRLTKHCRPCILICDAVQCRKAYVFWSFASSSFYYEQYILNMSKIILCLNFQKYIYMPVDRRVSWKEFFPVANKSNCNISLRLHMYNCREGSIYHIMGTPTWGRTLLSYAAPAMSYRGFKHRGNKRILQYLRIGLL
jgi:hypothetical protein